MIDALFWYTGLVAWILIVFGVVSGGSLSRFTIGQSSSK
jgi:hypothetical protein